MSFSFDGNVMDSHQRHQYQSHRQHGGHDGATMVALGSLASASTGIGPAVPTSPRRLGGGFGFAAGSGGRGSSVNHVVAAAAAAELRGLEHVGGGSLRHRHCGDEHPPGAAAAADGECYDKCSGEATAEDRRQGDDVEKVRNSQEDYGGDDDGDDDGQRRSESGGEDEPSPKRRKRSRSQRNSGGSGSTTTAGKTRNYPATRKTRTRKLAPATEEAYRSRDAALRELEQGFADLEGARLRVASAEERIRLAEREVASAEEAVVDAELSDPSNQKWNDMYRRLVEFRNENGHCNVHFRGGGDLGRFVASMRTLHKIPADADQKSLHRKPYRVRALERIGFAFDRLEEMWMENYGRLVDYRERHGDMDVPHSHGVALYNWVRSQAEQYRLYRHGDEAVRRAAHMDERRAALLEEVGVREFLERRKVAEAEAKAKEAEADGQPVKILSATDARWERRFSELVAFKEEHGHVDVRENGPLKKWVLDQRKLVRAFRDGRGTKGYKMTAERAGRLEELVGEEIVLQREFRWKQRYKELVSYRDGNGDCLVPRNYKNKQLAKWIETMRTTYRRQLKEQENDQEGKASRFVLTAERLRLLNEVGFVWDPVKYRKEARKIDVEADGKTNRETKSDEKWMQRYQELKAYREANGGSCLVSHIANKPLYCWCRRWKLEYRKFQEGKGSASLSQKRMELLKEIGFFESACDQQKNKKKRTTCDQKVVAKEDKTPAT